MEKITIYHQEKTILSIKPANYENISQTFAFFSSFSSFFSFFSSFFGSVFFGAGFFVFAFAVLVSIHSSQNLIAAGKGCVFCPPNCFPYRSMILWKSPFKSNPWFWVVINPRPTKLAVPACQHFANMVGLISKLFCTINLDGNRTSKSFFLERFLA